MEMILRQSYRIHPAIAFRLVMMHSLTMAILKTAWFLVKLLFGNNAARQECANEKAQTALYWKNLDILQAFGVPEERASIALIRAERPDHRRKGPASLLGVLAGEYSHARARLCDAILTSGKTLARAFTGRTKRAARATRPAVRQTFAARTAAKAADDGGGSSDPDGRRPHTSKTSNTAVSTPVQGGAK